MSSNLLGIDVHRYIILIIFTGVLLVLFLVFLYLGFKHEDPKDDDTIKEIEKTILSVAAWGFIIAIGAIWGLKFKAPWKKDNEA